MYAEVGGIWGAGVVVWVVDEAFCRTDGGLYVKAFVTALLNTFGVLDLAGKIEKTGMMVDLSISFFFFFLAIIALKPKILELNLYEAEGTGEDSATENCQNYETTWFTFVLFCAHVLLDLSLYGPVSIP